MLKPPNVTDISELNWSATGLTHGKRHTNMYTFMPSGRLSTPSPLLKSLIMSRNTKDKSKRIFPGFTASETHHCQSTRERSGGQRCHVTSQTGGLRRWSLMKMKWLKPFVGEFMWLSCINRNQCNSKTNAKQIWILNSFNGTYSQWLTLRSFLLTPRRPQRERDKEFMLFFISWELALFPCFHSPTAVLPYATYRIAYQSVWSARCLQTPCLHPRSQLEH